MIPKNSVPWSTDDAKVKDIAADLANIYVCYFDYLFGSQRQIVRYNNQNLKHQILKNYLLRYDKIQKSDKNRLDSMVTCILLNEKQSVRIIDQHKILLLN